MIINSVTPTFQDETTPVSYMVVMESGHEVEIPASRLFEDEKPVEDSLTLRDRIMDYLEEMYETQPQILFQKIN